MWSQWRVSVDTPNGREGEVWHPLMTYTYIHSHRPHQCSPATPAACQHGFWGRKKKTSRKLAAPEHPETTRYTETAWSWFARENNSLYVCTCVCSCLCRCDWTVVTSHSLRCRGPWQGWRRPATLDSACSSPLQSCGRSWTWRSTVI